MDSVKGAVLGAVAGLLVALGGAIKDAPYEGFEAVKFARSPVIGALCGAFLGDVFRDDSDPLIFLSSMACERIVVEMYKVIRAMGGSYVPMKFIYGEWGRPKELTEEGKKRLSSFIGKGVGTGNGQALY